MKKWMNSPAVDEKTNVELKERPDGDKMGVVISYDSRKMSEEFAKECASVPSVNGITA